jgi:hypothetical protein
MCLAAVLVGQNLLVIRPPNIQEDSWTGKENKHARRSDPSSSKDPDESFDRHPSKEHIKEGIISDEPFEFFQKIRDEIDVDDPFARCERYGFKYLNRTEPRRIFYGALIANEPWELFEITGAEMYGLFSGMVFVEGNRTQNFSPRKAVRQSHGPAMAQIFGVSPDRVQLRLRVNEDPDRFRHDVDQYLSREQWQRQDILNGWKELGMEPDDLGYLTDSDEIFTRDFMRALQYCDKIRHLDYPRGRCKHTETGLKAAVLVFESSPECVTKDRWWYKSDVFLGRCVEEIGDELQNPKAPRPRPDSMDRARGWGDRETGSWAGEDNVTDGRYPMYNAGDMRRIGGAQMRSRRQEGHAATTGYHFHNFFAGSDAIRFKYRTYGHPLGDRASYKTKLGDIHEDLDLVVRCVKNDTTKPARGYQLVAGGLLGQLPPHPVYLRDAQYRRKRHYLVSSIIEADEREWRRHNNVTSPKDETNDGE